MKFESIASLILTLCLTGSAQADRINVKSIVPTLNHAVYKTGADVNAPTTNARSAVSRSAEFSAEGLPGAEAAKLFVANKFGYVDGQDFVVKNSYTSSNGITHTYLKQIFDGKEVVNGDFNINTNKEGKVISYGNSFHASKASLKRRADTPENYGNSVDAVEALFKHINVDLGVPKDKLSVVEGRSLDGSAVVKGVPSVPEGVKATQKYIQTATGELTAVWDLEADLGENWFNAFVTPSNQVVGLHDWVHEAKYNVYPIGINDPSDGARKVITDQGTPATSPAGWHDQGNGQKFTTTTGNNVIAIDNRNLTSDWTKAPRVDGGADLKFDFPIDLTKEPETYINGAVSQLFYSNNAYHDILYAHGFNEDAGNFQENNFGKGGLGGDAVRAQAQDGAGFNNANFATPPDGQRPRMRMYVWNRSTPKRDGDLDNGIIIHEYSHGLSNRLTGGPSNVGCLQTYQSGGMGEGWGDTIATALRINPNKHNRNTNFAMGDYSNTKGIRTYPYSTSLTTNPFTYESINGSYLVHFIGSVWASILYEVEWNLIDKIGFTNDLLSGNTHHGNTFFIRILIDGMKLQPCYPTFIEARDAIITATEQLNKGHLCEVWRGFAKRGLGVDAKLTDDGVAVNGFKKPVDC
ncbi:hypothetical protein CONCODRAFT_44361 [Conidiobolus coronatus NRRL 28638]|uniref:Extracellular metalloproteinase n=1 Tax=Conidiobolus coronatus (strain ATCC 28846 / CBS 209.66 / NRRL 28638) TaxID=796925 RepID=A0A137NSF9_CONC2|nr:hypothetical protein CONCODRAFT_44361 [Conidiobolus coronatus NRRL 28638]|eukprot:KXN65632.1 hypothetical protein CONCODRAFT_44361 [Conidiobolus coronatus NRRL 28638]